MPKQPALAPDEEYDFKGIFTGGMAPIQSDKKLHAFYTSVCAGPFHWHTPPYPRNAAGLALATSEDGGLTWTKSKQNPILIGEPEDVHVSGWRDPYIAKWSKLDSLRGTDEYFYGLVSGGTHDIGPTSFLYAVHPREVEDWQYIGPLIDLPLSWNPSDKWSGNFGINWECVNFMTLSTTDDQGQSADSNHDFLILGAECAVERPAIEDHSLPKNLPARTRRTQIFMQGELTKSSSGEIRMNHNFSGLFDHGSYYAANSFVDPKTSRRIVYGWLPEEDTSLEHAGWKGWNGALALPREVFVLSIPNVMRALKTPLKEISSVSLQRESEKAPDLSTVMTMGFRPYEELYKLRDHALRTVTIDSFTINTASNDTKVIGQTRDPTWELETTIRVEPSCKTVGLRLKHSADSSVCTTLSFDLEQEKITLDRSQSLSDPVLLDHVNTCPDTGPFTLFTTQNPTTGAEQLEELRIRIFADSDFLEVFVNDRFAIGTVVYTRSYETCGGISAFATGVKSAGIERNIGSQPLATFKRLRIWDGLNGGRSLFDDRNLVRLKKQDDAAAVLASKIPKL